MLHASPADVNYSLLIKSDMKDSKASQIAECWIATLGGGRGATPALAAVAAAAAAAVTSAASVFARGRGRGTRLCLRRGRICCAVPSEGVVRMMCRA